MFMLYLPVGKQSILSLYSGTGGDPWIRYGFCENRYQSASEALGKIALTILPFEVMKTQLSSLHASLAIFSLVPPTFYLSQIF